jgi:formate dehydrogenase subunit delta
MCPDRVSPDSRTALVGTPDARISDARTADAVTGDVEAPGAEAADAGSGDHAPGDRLVYMANQIAGFFATQPGEAQAEGVARHLRSFWEPRMLEQLQARIDAGAPGLSPLVLEAAALLRRETTS